MTEESLISISRNPNQTVQSVVKLFGFRVRGNAVYVFFGGLAAGVLTATFSYQISFALAGTLFLLWPVLSIFFIRKFIAGRARFYFWFWLDQQLTGPYLRKPIRRSSGYETP